MEVDIAVSISVPTSSMKGYSFCWWMSTLAPVEDTRKGLYSSSLMYKMTCSPGIQNSLLWLKARKHSPQRSRGPPIQDPGTSRMY